MSFGVSVGDIIAISKLASTIRRQFIDAPDQLKAISDEVKSLSNVIRDIEDTVPQRDLSLEQEADLKEIVDGCGNVLNELDQVLQKHQDLNTNPKSLGGKSRKVWKRFKWEPDNIRDLRLRIASNIGLLNTFNGNLNSQIFLSTKAGVDRLGKNQDDQERRAILDWLTPIDFASEQSDLVSRRQEGTGQWVLHSSEFQNWLNTSKQTLFCPGIPGAGKTMISSIVVDHLCTKSLNDPTVGIAYLYCNYNRHTEQKSTELLMSLLKQYVQELPCVPDRIKYLYRRYQDKRVGLSFDEILEALHSVVCQFARAFIIIDALDECRQEARAILLPEIFRLQTESGANIFATSRPIPEIKEAFKGSMFLQIHAIDEDVRRYVEGHMPRLPSFVSRNPDLQQIIKTEISRAVDGMFLLAQLHMDSLTDKTSAKAIKLALQRLPQGSEALDIAYDKAVERLESQKAGFQDLARRVLSWITYAERPLTALELQHALAVETGEPALDQDNLPEVGDMISVCAGLVTLNEENNIIRFVHYTTQEYFTRILPSWVPNAQVDIAEACLTYLSFDVFATGPCSTNQEVKARLELNPLCSYAAANWGYHAGAALPQAKDLTLKFLRRGTLMDSCFQSGLIHHKSEPRQITGMHLVARSGWTKVMKILLEDGHDPNLKDSWGTTPLGWAAIFGNDMVVKLLLSEPHIDLNSKNIHGNTALSLAAFNGHDAVVKLLLSEPHVDLNSKDSHGNTALSWAAIKGRGAVVKLLLSEPHIDLNSKNNDGNTALSWAAMDGHDAMVKLLLSEPHVDLNSKNNDGNTALSVAVTWEKGAMVKLLLLQDNIDVNSVNYQGKTALLHAAEKGLSLVVKQLLAHDGISVDTKNINGETALSLATKKGNEDIVELLNLHSNTRGNESYSRDLDQSSAAGSTGQFSEGIGDDGDPDDKGEAAGLPG